MKVRPFGDTFYRCLSPSITLSIVYLLFQLIFVIFYDSFKEFKEKTLDRRL